MVLRTFCSSRSQSAFLNKHSTSFEESRQLAKESKIPSQWEHLQQGATARKALSARVTTTPLLFEAVEAAAARHGQSHVPERE